MRIGKEISDVGAAVMDGEDEYVECGRISHLAMGERSWSCWSVWKFGEGRPELVDSGFEYTDECDDGEWHHIVCTYDGSSLEPGATCCGCGEHYEYAERAADFKCWACRNGY
jgi:hypothetical protein